MDALLAEIARLASIFALAFFSFWAAIPAGLALGLSPLVVVLITTLSYASGAALVTLVGGDLRDRVMRRAGQSVGQPQGRLRRIWARYGLAGLALTAPMTVGAQLGAALGVMLAVPRLRLTAALTLGALVWSIGLTAAVTLGLLALGGPQP